MVRNYILDHKSIKGFKLSGKGSFGDVTRAVYRDRCVAVKSYKKDVLPEVIEREIAIMQTMRHERHVIQYLGHFNVDGIAHVVMDFAYNLSVFQLLTTVLKQMSRSLKTRIARDICRGLLAFHNKGMVHEDIKSDNVVLDFGLRARLCDFGSSRTVDEPPVTKSGTPAFRAPERKEYIEGKRDSYDPMKSDIYSLGIVLSRLLGSNDSIAVRCKCPDPNQRPTCAQVLEQLGADQDERVLYDHFSGFFPLQPTEAEKLNLAYYWTGFKRGEKPQSLSHVRELMFQGDYKQAKEKLAEIDDQSPALQLMGAITDFYGSRDGDSRAKSRSVLEGIKHKFEEASLSRLAADYFSAAYALEEDEREGAKRLYRLSINGNALAQVELSKFYGCKRRVPVDRLHSRIAETASFMCSAASSGLADAQAMLTILALLQHGSTSVPGSVKVSLDMGVEGGSPIGQIFKDVAENKVYDIFEANPDLCQNVALVQLCADICRILKRTECSKKWYSVAAEAGCADAAHCLAVMALKDRDYSAAEGWCKKAMQLNPGPKRSGKSKVEDMFLQDPKFFLITTEYLVVATLVLQGKIEEAIEKVKSSTDYSFDGIMSLFRIERACSTVGGGENTNVWYRLLCEKSEHANSAETLSFIAESYVSNGKSYSLNFADFVTPPADPTKSLHFSFKGAERGHHHSICRLAELLRNRYGEVDRGIALLQQASQEGYAVASFALSGHFSSIGDPEKSMEYLELASAQGEPGCMLELARKILNSQPKRAKQLLKQCLEEGYLEACKLLSVLECKEGNRSRSIYWMERALSLVSPYTMHGDEFFYNTRHFMKWNYLHRNDLTGDILSVLSMYESCMSGYRNWPRKMVEFLCLTEKKGSIVAREQYERLLSMLRSQSRRERKDVFLLDLSICGREFHPYGLECSRCAREFEDGDRGLRCFECGYYELCKECWAENMGCSDHGGDGLWEVFELRKGVERENIWASSTVVDSWQTARYKVVCDGCNVLLDGVTERCKCVLCTNYDLCKDCYGKCREIHPEHIFWYSMRMQTAKKLWERGKDGEFPSMEEAEAAAPGEASAGQSLLRRT